MESKTSALLAIRFASRFERHDHKLVVEGPGPTPGALLREIPEWAPKQTFPTLERLAPGPVDHYESWEGICW